ncbi:YaiI/YqxD family protein [Limibacillus sp. MBR-115]|jgi:uncharacterized protein YaiI (UPF0178 family)|uniref:YaiI/YqxD family protein n=1 Tax=Limibacillus sp. MBR-115 TaxID=3156465 RepID=UPI003398E1DD
MTRLFIDADACPVKREALRIAERHGLQVFMVSNGGIRPDPSPLVETIIVPADPDAADRWIAERIEPGDICVTQDTPLAAVCIGKGGSALRANGEPFTQNNIGNAMAMRDLMADLRAANPLAAMGSGRSFTKADRSRFLGALDTLIRKLHKAGS